MKLYVLAVLFLVLGMAGCASKNDPRQDFDEKLRSATPDKQEQVGLKDDKVYIKKKIFLEERLFQLKRESEDLENSIYGKSVQEPGGLWLALKDCRTRVSDPRLGGTGVPDPMEKWEKITDTGKDYVFMIDKNKNVVGVSEEELDSRITRLEKNKSLLSDMYNAFNDKLVSCETKYRTALIQQGLNPNDTKSKGEWVDGPDGYKVWRMKRASTTDPEELMKRKKDDNR